MAPAAALRWAQEYRVYRGELADLFDSDADGLVDPGYGQCASGSDVDTTDTTIQVAQDPLPGEGYYYLIGLVDGDGDDSLLGAASSNLPRSPASSCP